MALRRRWLGAAARAREEYEVALLAERVAKRTAGYSGWDPPEGREDLMPYDEWESVVKLFPHALQREFSRPLEDETSSFGDMSAKLSAEVALSVDSGISLSVVQVLSEDADEDGAYKHRSVDVEYTLWVDRKDWSGDSVNELRAHLKLFEKTLEDLDPAGYAKFSGKRF